MTLHGIGPGKKRTCVGSLINHVQFPNSWRNPILPGYGTFPAPFVSSNVNAEQVARGFQVHIERALSIGYRHIDTAYAYRNQDLVGAAIRAQGMPRQDVFVTSKLHPSNNSYREASLKIKQAIRLMWGEDAGRLGHYLDAFLIHYPGLGNPIEAWKALIAARKEGLVRHVGVSNFEIRHLEKLHERTGESAEINQIEFHPFIYVEQSELLDFCNTRCIAVEGYSPLAEGQALNDENLRAIANEHNTSPARIALRWSMQHGVRPIVGTRSPAHLRENAEPYNFTLSAEEMLRIDSLGRTKPVRVSLRWNWNPKSAPLGSSKWRSWFGSLPRRIRRVLRGG